MSEKMRTFAAAKRYRSDTSRLNRNGRQLVTLVQGSSVETGCTFRRSSPSSSQQSWWKATVYPIFLGRVCCGFPVFVPLHDVSQLMKLNKTKKNKAIPVTEETATSSPGVVFFIMNKQDLEKKYQEAKNIVNDLSKAGMVIGLIKAETEYDMVVTSALQIFINQMFLRCVNVNGFNRVTSETPPTEDNCRPTWQQLTDCIAERLKIVRWQDPWDERSAEIWNEVKIHKDKWFRFYTDEDGVQRVDTTYEAI